MRKILVVEDDPAASFLIEAHLEQGGYDYSIVDCGSDALESAQEFIPDIILLDLVLPDGSGIDLIPRLKAINKNAVIIVVTGQKSADSALEAIKAGAKDYIVKPIERERLYVSIENALSYIELHTQVKTLKKDRKKEFSFHGIVGNSSPMRDLYKAIENSALCSHMIYIKGESGTGKTLCARTIHKLSSFSEGPFVTYTTPTRETTSKKAPILKDIEKARGGTLYLCDISLLSNLDQEALMSNIGEDLDLRIISSSSKDPHATMKDGHLRTDLFYRLHTLPFTIPPLRNRGNDIKLLATYFLKKIAKENDKSFEFFDEKCFPFFTAHHWPGNIREMENLVRSIVLMNPDAETVKPTMLPEPLSNIHATKLVEDKVLNTQINQNEYFEGQNIIPLAKLEKLAINHALEACDGNVQKAAMKLGISSATLYRKRSDDTANKRLKGTDA